jgi:hypothetical protein
MVKRLLSKLGYIEGEPQQFLSKRVCGISEKFIITLSYLSVIMNFL